MPQEAEAGKRFARDMRRIRDAHNLTVGDLHDETKIPVGLIEAFEATALFDHPQFNRVYLRSFVRTYAQVVGVDADLALEGLEEALTGRYAGSLAAEYLGEAVEPVGEPTEDARDARKEPEEAPEAETEARAEAPEIEAKAPDEPPEAEAPPKAEAPAEAPEEEAQTSEEAAETSAEAAEEASGPAAGTAEVDEEEIPADEPASRPPKKKGKKRKEVLPPPETEVAADESEEEGGAPIVSTTGEAAASYDERAPEEEPVEEDWSSQSPPSGRTAGAVSREGRPRRPGGPDRRWVIAGAMIIVVAAVVWILISVLGDSEPDTAEPVAAADTVQTEDTTAQQPQRQPISVPTIGDSIDVRIIASEGKVDPIRVTVDDDLRRPYWIDQGDSMTFRPSDRIVIEELLENIDLKVEGIDYPTDRRDPQGRLVITRDTLQNYFASLQGEQ